MKPIELTKEHKSKLLEMCNKLFPEYEFDYEPELYGKGIGQEIDCLSIYGKNTYKNIHWFEFCLYYLVDKIFDDTKEESYITNKDFYMGGLVYRNHTHNPIDILYKEFKKLK